MSTTSVTIIPDNCDCRSTTDFINAMAWQGLVSPDVLPAFARLGEVLTLVHSSMDDKVQTFQIDNPNSGERLFITLTVLKGSIMTYLWSAFARAEEEYIVTVSDSRKGGSIVGQPQLWFVKGVDVNDERTHAGRVNWELMRRLQRFAGVTDIGLLSFAKLITKILISMPIYRSLGYCQTPMPASIMCNNLFLVDTVPLVMHPSIHHMEHFDAAVQLLYTPHGSGLTLTQFRLFWTSAGSKVLHNAQSLHRDPSLLRPVHSLWDVPDRSRVRVVELFPHDGLLAAVVEIIDCDFCFPPSRYVVLDLPRLLDAAKAITMNQLENAPDIPLIDSIEWMRVQDFRRAMGKPTTRVDLQNSYKWGQPVSMTNSIHID